MSAVKACVYRLTIILIAVFQCSVKIFHVVVVSAEFLPIVLSRLITSPFYRDADLSSGCTRQRELALPVMQGRT